MKHSFVLSVLCFALPLGIASFPSSAAPKHKHDDSRLSIDCGKAKATIQCDPKGTYWKGPPRRWEGTCLQTTLRLMLADGRVMNLAKPKGMKDYTAVGLACRQANNDTSYLMVQYGERPVDCQFCEWFHLYTTQGELLTSSDPPVLTDDALPDGKTQIPNNRQFYEIRKKLDLKGPKIEFFDQ